MGRLIAVLLILFSCSDKTDSSNLIDMYKQVLIGDEFIIITMEKEWFNSNLFLLNHERDIVQKTILPFEEKAFVKLEKNENLDIYYFVKDKDERSVIERTIDASPIYLNEQIKITVFFIENYKVWKERDDLIYKDFSTELAEMSFYHGDVVEKVPFHEVLRHNLTFYRVLFNDGYLNYYPIKNYEDLHSDLQTLIRLPLIRNKNIPPK